MFERIFTFLVSTSWAFVLITSMEDLGKIIGFEQMGDLGISMVFGAVYLHLMILDSNKKDKKEKDEEKDRKELL